MSVGQIFSLIITAMASMQKNGLLDAAGNLVKMPAQQEAEAAAKVAAELEPVLVSAGVKVPAELGKIILAAPQIIALV